MIRTLAVRLVTVLFVILVNGCATSAIDPNTKPDYQSLIGEWEWTYPVGVSTLTISSISAVGDKILIEAFYKPCPPSCGKGKGMPMTSLIDPQRRPDEMTFTLVNGSKINLRWDGGNHLWGNAILQTWSGGVDFYKK